MSITTLRLGTVLTCGVLLASCSGSSSPNIAPPKTASSVNPGPISAPPTSLPTATSATECGFVAPGLTEGVDLTCLTVKSGNAIIFVTLIGDPNVTRNADPIVHLPGGPGASSEAYAPILGSLYRDLGQRTGRMVVLVDQRGTGRSKPFLKCDEPSKALECIAVWKADGIDPLTITTQASADDVVAVADALGATQVNLWGASYGSRLALEVARRHPERLRSLLIESVDTQDTPLRTAVGVKAALARIKVECTADTTCAELKVDLNKQVEASLSVLTAKPLETLLGSIDANVYVSTLLTLMEASIGTSLVPLWVWSIANNEVGVAQALLAQANSEPQPAGPFSIAMNAIVNCGDLAPFAPQDIIDSLAASAKSNLDRAIAEGINAQYGDKACSTWPHAIDGPTTPVAAATPTLAFAGEHDSNTPLNNAALAIKTLSSSKLVSFPGYGHFPMHRGDNPCAARIYASFVENPTGKVDQSCVSPATFRVEAGSIDRAALKTFTLADLGAMIDLPSEWMDLRPGTKISGDGSIVAVQPGSGPAAESLTAVMKASGVTSPSIISVSRNNISWTQAEGIVGDQIVLATFVSEGPSGAPVITLVSSANKAQQARTLLNQITSTLRAGS